MTNLCLYFQVHQPFRLIEYSFLDIGKHKMYGDNELNKSIVERVSKKCYLPTNQLLMHLIERFGDRFKVSFSISGTALEQFERYCPEVITSFQTLINTGNIELLNETYYHSLASVFHKEEFYHQIQLHQQKIEAIFGVKPKVFRNTELIYNNEIAQSLQKLKFRAILCEGVNEYLGGKSPDYVYQTNGDNRTPLLLRNRELSDDISFRFSDKSWSQYPLTAKKFTDKLLQYRGRAEIINLFMDYETFGEHQSDETGILNFLEKLPEEILKHRGLKFLTPTEVVNRLPPRTVYDVPKLTSWADQSRDISTWLGNEMQKEIAQKIYSLHHKITHKRSKKLSDIWRKLQTSDHLYYMSTKTDADGAVHDYFRHFDSAYDAYITYKNILQDFEEQVTEYSFERT